MALAAGLMGNEAEARKYNELAASIRQAFNAKFYHPDTGLYGNGSQTSLSCALYQGLVEPANKARVLSNLVAAVEKTNGHIDTGILGAKYLLNALLENGRADVAYRIASQKDLPSWGWWIEQGATTLWEQWNGTESRNHIMFGDISAWFYKALAGINPDPAAPAFKHFIIKPNLVGGLTSAEASYDSVRGRIVSDWKIANGSLDLNVTIPANTTATVCVPAADSASIKEGGNPAAEAEGVNDSFAWKTAAPCSKSAPAPTTSPRPCSGALRQSWTKPYCLPIPGGARLGRGDSGVKDALPAMIAGQVRGVCATAGSPLSSHMEKNRLEAFSDGVLAIIITIMVLELKVPHGSDCRVAGACCRSF